MMESIDKPVLEVTRQLTVLKTETTWIISEGSLQLYDPLTRHEEKRRVINYYLNFHVTALLEHSIANYHIKLLIVAYLIVY